MLNSKADEYAAGGLVQSLTAKKSRIDETTEHVNKYMIYIWKDMLDELQVYASQYLPENKSIHSLFINYKERFMNQFIFDNPVTGHPELLINEAIQYEGVRNTILSTFQVLCYSQYLFDLEMETPLANHMLRAYAEKSVASLQKRMYDIKYDKLLESHGVTQNDFLEKQLVWVQEQHRHFIAEHLPNTLKPLRFRS